MRLNHRMRLLTALAIASVFVMVPFAAPLVAQVIDTTAQHAATGFSVGDFLLNLLKGIVPVVGAAASVYLFGLINKGTALLAALPDPLKQILVGIVGGLVTKLCVVIGASVGVIDPQHFTSDQVNTLVTAGLAYLLYGHNQNKAILSAANAPKP